jgi:hypothetical protein
MCICTGTQKIRTTLLGEGGGGRGSRGQADNITIFDMTSVVDPDPDFCGSRRAKITRKMYKLTKIIFLSAGCSLLRAEGFSYSLEVLYGGNFDQNKIIQNFQLYLFFNLVIKTLDLDPDPFLDSLEMLDPDPNSDSMNPDPQHCNEPTPRTTTHCKSGSHKNGIRKSSRKTNNHILGI